LRNKGEEDPEAGEKAGGGDREKAAVCFKRLEIINTHMLSLLGAVHSVSL
jgi:hypothetical protein